MKTKFRINILNTFLFPEVRLSIAQLRSKTLGKTVLITGASFGIGEALVHLLAAKGVRLILVARTEAKLQELKCEVERKGGMAEVFALDLRSEAAREGLIQFLKADSQGVDILIHNAGKSIRRSLDDSLDRYHDYTRTMAINYFAPVALSLALIDGLGQRRGQIISVSALNLLLPPAPHWGAYHSSKGAFDLWLRSISPELKVKGIVSTSIYFPLVRTRMIAPTTLYNHAPAMTPERAARLVACAITTRCRSYRPWWARWVMAFSFLFRPLWQSVTYRIFLNK